MCHVPRRTRWDDAGTSRTVSQVLSHIHIYIHLERSSAAVTDSLVVTAASTNTCAIKWVEAFPSRPASHAITGRTIAEFKPHSPAADPNAQPQQGAKVGGQPHRLRMHARYARCSLLRSREPVVSLLFHGCGVVSDAAVYICLESGPSEILLDDVATTC